MSPVSKARRPRLAVVATHPIQYHEPLYRALAANGAVDLEVNYIRIPTAAEQGVGFGLPFQWDLEMRNGYPSKVLRTYPLGKGFFRAWLRSFGAVLRNSRPDVVMVTGWNEWALCQSVIQAKICGVPVIVRGDSNDLRPRSISRRLIHKAAIRMFDACLCVGESNRNFYRQAGIPNDRLFTSPHSVDNTRFAHQAAEVMTERLALRREWGVPGSACCYVFVGKLQPAKRIHDFLEALGEVHRLNVGVWGLVAGAGEELHGAVSLAQRHQLPVAFTGFLNQTEIAKAYVAADALIMPSEHETWGLVVNEAMACGRAAFVSDRVGCGPDLIRPGQTGEVFPFGDTRALAELMRRYAGQPAELGRMGAAAQRLVMEDYSVEKSVDGVLKAVEFVLAKGRGG